VQVFHKRERFLEKLAKLRGVSRRLGTDAKSIDPRIRGWRTIHRDTM
jgi:hypothetical protein